MSRLYVKRDFKRLVYTVFLTEEDFKAAERFLSVYYMNYIIYKGHTLQR